MTKYLKEKLLRAAEKDSEINDAELAIMQKELEWEERLSNAVCNAAFFNNSTTGVGDSIEEQTGTVWIDTMDGTVSFSPQLTEE